MHLLAYKVDVLYNILAKIMSGLLSISADFSKIRLVF